MKLMYPQNRRAKLFFSLALILLLFSASFHAQTRRTSVPKKTDVKKKQTQAKDAKKDTRKGSKKEQLAKKNTKSDPRKDKASAKSKDARSAKSKVTKKEKLTAKDKAREKDSKSKEKDSKNKKDPKSRAEARRAELERRKAEEARRQAALAEQRRREQAALEARARRLAFERGLRTATIENIANDNPEGEDPVVRRAAVNALGSHAGTVVVMEAQTGKVVTIVNQEWAIKNSFKPCSTIKLVTGVAGINENVISEDGGIRNSSGRMNLDDALAFSSNGYFQRVGANMGSTKLIDYAKRLGLGERTGINAEGETPGRLPYGNNNARIYSHGDDFEVTPLQLAVMVSAISNGGKKVVPQVARPRVEKAAFQPHLKEQLSVPKSSVEGVIPGMIGAAEYGTARRGVDASMGVAGKTGSCISKGSWVGLFASVAPVEDPKYSVVVITRGERERGKYAAAIAGQVYRALDGRMPRNPELNIARKAMKPKPAFDPTLARIDEEEDDSDSPEAVREEDESTIIVGARPDTAATQPKDIITDIIIEARPKTATTQPVETPTVIVSSKPVSPAPKRMVQKTAQSKPAFKPVIITYDKSGAGSGAQNQERLKERPRIVKNK